MSEESKDKIRNNPKCRFISKEGRKRLSDRMKGNKINVGRKLSEETKKKISKIKMGNQDGINNTSRDSKGRFIKKVK